MKDDAIFTDGEAAQKIDRLVCGELDETERRGLIDWFEQEPARWRLCGLAFLEAQSWTQALGHWPCPAAVGELQPLVLASSLNKTTTIQRTGTVRRTLMALGICLAFGLGFAVSHTLGPESRSTAGSGTTASHGEQTAPQHDDFERQKAPSEPVMADLYAMAGGDPGSATPIRIPVVPVAAEASGGLFQEESIPDYVRRQWERKGYKVSLERRFVFARLSDGQQVVVPVQQYHLDRIPVQIN